MKSRELLTTPVLIVTDYTITPDKSGKFLHTFTPETTSTLYQFLANREPVLEQGQRYNVGYRVDECGVNWVDTSATARAADVDPYESYAHSRKLGEQERANNIRKNDARVVHGAKDGYYLGKKYAWRIYGMAVARDLFDRYLSDIGHPTVPCRTEDNPSIAYKEDGLEEAMKNLVASAVHVGGNRFSSPLVPSKRWFQFKGLTAITDKK